MSALSALSTNVARPVAAAPLEIRAGSSVPVQKTRKKAAETRPKDKTIRLMIKFDMVTVTIDKRSSEVTYTGPANKWCHYADAISESWWDNRGGPIESRDLLSYIGHRAPSTAHTTAIKALHGYRTHYFYIGSDDYNQPIRMHDKFLEESTYDSLAEILDGFPKKSELNILIEIDTDQRKIDEKAEQVRLRAAKRESALHARTQRGFRAPISPFAPIKTESEPLFVSTDDNHHDHRVQKRAHSGSPGSISVGATPKRACLPSRSSEADGTVDCSLISIGRPPATKMNSPDIEPGSPLSSLPDVDLLPSGKLIVAQATRRQHKDRPAAPVSGRVMTRAQSRAAS